MYNCIVNLLKSIQGLLKCSDRYLIQCGKVGQPCNKLKWDGGGVSYFDNLVVSIIGFILPPRLIGGEQFSDKSNCLNNSRMVTRTTIVLKCVHYVCMEE